MLSDIQMSIQFWLTGFIISMLVSCAGIVLLILDLAKAIKLCHSDAPKNLVSQNVSREICNISLKVNCQHQKRKRMRFIIEFLLMV